MNRYGIDFTKKKFWNLNNLNAQWLIMALLFYIGFGYAFNLQPIVMIVNNIALAFISLIISMFIMLINKEFRKSIFG